MDVLTFSAFFVSAATAIFAMYTYFCFMRLKGAMQILEQRLKAEHERVGDVRQEMIAFMKVVHSKWDDEDRMRALKNGVGPASLETTFSKT